MNNTVIKQDLKEVYLITDQAARLHMSGMSDEGKSTALMIYYGFVFYVRQSNPNPELLEVLDRADVIVAQAASGNIDLRLACAFSMISDVIWSES